MSNKDAEILILQVEQKCTTPYILVSVYRPPQGNQTQFIEGLGVTLNELTGMGARNIVVVGDVNIDILFKRESKIVKDLKTIQQEFALKQLITTATRTTSSCQSLIDHIYTNVNNDMIADSGVLEETISDHNPVYCIIKKPKLKYERVSFTCRQMKNYTYEGLYNELEMIDWAGFWECIK